ncbi:MAG: aldo/keto reductase [Kiritimatiellae bacterium]|nr:aldo/keto reductase [Kiritimatiellia bacterium]
MQYRDLGKTGLKVSALALGCMRFDPNNPELAEQIVDEAIAAGVNYFETARGYVAGKCQQLTAHGLKGRSRGLIVSGKAGINAETTAAGYRAEIDLQMQTLGVDYLEFYQVGWFSLAKMEFLTKKDGALEALDKARNEGIIGHIGFTGHDSPENFTKCIETGIFDSCTVPYNMLNRAYAPTIKRAGELGVGVIAMCPVAGGMLASPSPQLQQLIPGGAKTTADAALRFVLANQDVTTACSGMNTVEMLRENLETTNNFHGVNAEDFRRMDAILDEFHSLGERFCTMCGYCNECQEGVDIPGNFHLYNLAKVYGMTDWARAQYAAKEADKRADACIRCGKCELKCPHKLQIMEQLAEVTKTLG